MANPTTTTTTPISTSTTTASSSSTSPRYEVHLAIYDLSRGMARSLSIQFLGPSFAIDAIPHTGIVVYNREYFFGQGIQYENPMVFRTNLNLYPIEIRSLGYTTVTQQEFDHWCRNQMNHDTGGSYTTTSYDLLHRNCNHFSHDAALQGLRLVQGVPDWILNVPQQFISSPMGQIIRPILDNMQLGNNYTQSSTSSTATSVRQEINVGATQHANILIGTSSTSNNKNNNTSNPWAENKNDISSSKPTGRTRGTTSTPLLDSLNQPLTSNEIRTIPICIQKLKTNIQEDNKDELHILETSGELLLLGGKQLQDNHDVSNKLGILLLRILEHNTTTSCAYTLMLLRIVILKAIPTSFQACIHWLHQFLSDRDRVKELTTSSRAVHPMAWLCLSNAVALDLVPNLDEKLIKSALADLSVVSQIQVEVRQAVAAFFYNIALQHSKKVQQNQEEDISDLHVSMICAVMENLTDETDSTVQFRLLMILSRLIQSLGRTVSATAKDMVNSLDLPEILQQIASTPISGVDSSKCQQLALELLTIIK